MADIEAKLNMSLEDLAKKEKRKEMPDRHHGPDRQRGGGRAGGRAGFGRRGNQQQQQWGNGPYHQQQHQQWSRGPTMQGQQQHGADFQGLMHNPEAAAALQHVRQEQWGPQQQQHWGPSGGTAGFGNNGHRQRPSVFARLGGVQQHDGPRQKQQPQQQQQQQRPAAPPRKAPKVQCRVDESSADVVISHSGHDIIKVSQTGDVLLDSGGFHTQQMLDAFNCVLSHLNMSVKAPSGDPTTGQWSVSDNKQLLRFADGMIIRSKGPVTAGRAMVLMQAYSSGMSKAAAAAAEQASKQAAIAAGLLPTSAAAGGDAVVEDEAARIRRLKAQGRYQPY